MAENNYIDSSKITMYPSAYRGQNGEGKVYNPTSYLNTEDNITSLIRSVASKDCFIIDSNEGTGHRVRLCMRGYVFDFELDGLAFFGGLVFIHQKRGIVEEVVTAILSVDEAIALLLVEHFNCSLHETPNLPGSFGYFQINRLLL